MNTIHDHLNPEEMSGDVVLDNVEDLIMQYAAPHGRMSAADKARITNAALSKIDAIENYAAHRSKKKALLWIPIGIITSLAISVGAYLATRSTSVDTAAEQSSQQSNTINGSIPSKNYTSADVNKKLQFDYNIVSDAASRHVPMHGKDYAVGMRTQVFWNELTNVMFIDKSSLPSAPQGEVYSVWSIKDDGSPSLVGTLTNEQGATPLVKVGCEPQSKRVVITKSSKSSATEFSASRIVFDSQQ